MKFRYAGGGRIGFRAVPKTDAFEGEILIVRKLLRLDLESRSVAGLVRCAALARDAMAPLADNFRTFS